MDLTGLTDEELDDLRRNVLIEQERRANLAAIPDRIAQDARTYLEGGGDPHVLEAALATTTE